MWTPVHTQSRRVPRSKVRREIDAPIMPTFVFARADEVDTLIGILALPINPHPAFSIFRHGGRIPLVADSEIAGARAVEERAKRTKLKAERHIFAVGSSVKLTEGAFAGMAGEVIEQDDGKFALVCFGGRHAVKIATFLLRTDEVQGRQPTTGSAALAA